MPLGRAGHQNRMAQEGDGGHRRSPYPRTRERDLPGLRAKIMLIQYGQAMVTVSISSVVYVPCDCVLAWDIRKPTD